MENITILNNVYYILTLLLTKLITYLENIYSQKD